jgi:hypothetical protein
MKRGRSSSPVSFDSSGLERAVGHWRLRVKKTIRKRRSTESPFSCVVSAEDYAAQFPAGSDIVARVKSGHLKPQSFATETGLREG